MFAANFNLEALQSVLNRGAGKDPVCGMEIAEGKAAATSTYNGTTYQFCAVGCKEAFEADPQKYVAKS